MINANDVADKIRQFARQYRDMQDIADTLQRVGSLEQATAECEKQVTVARARRDAEIAEIDAELAVAKQMIVDAEAASDNQLKAANADADDIKRTAQIEAARTQAAAQRLLDEAKAQAERIKSKAKGVETNALANVAKINADADAASKRLKDLAIEAGQVEARLAKARADVAKLLGA